MEKFKKIISGLCALLAIPTLGVSATGNTYLRGDVDGNGTVNMVDLTCVNQYLNGHAAYIEQEDGQKTVIGIHTGGLDGNDYNCGTRMNTSILHFVYNNPNL